MADQAMAYDKEKNGDTQGLAIFLKRSFYTVIKKQDTERRRGDNDDQQTYIDKETGRTHGRGFPLDNIYFIILIRSEHPLMIKTMIQPGIYRHARQKCQAE